MYVSKVFLCSVLVVSGDESEVKRVEISMPESVLLTEDYNVDSYYPAKAAKAARWTKIAMLKNAKIYDVKAIKEIKGN